jgi:hypothetical protein
MVVPGNDVAVVVVVVGCGLCSQVSTGKIYTLFDVMSPAVIRLVQLRLR